MDKKEEERIVELADSNPELKKLWEEHRKLEKQLANINHKGLLNAEEELEKKNLQKVKLAGRDRIMEILAQS